MNDLNAFNRMLTVKFELRIDWYTNKRQISSTTDERNDVSLRSIAQQDSISSVHELIFNNHSVAQQDCTVVGYIKVRQLYRVFSPSAHVLLSFCVE